MMRAYFLLCSAAGWLLRSGKYSRVRIVCQHGQRRVRKRRLFYAPLLVWLGGPLVRALNTGVRVLPQRDWEQRERRINWSLRGSSIRIDPGGTVVMPHLAGTTLASVLEDQEVGAPARKRAIAWAVVALADFHRLGFTHGDAMAENVLVDPAARVAHWFDFETVHDSARPMLWRRADDLRALLATCVVRTAPEERADIVEHIVDVYQDSEVTRLVAASFSSVYRRPLPFYLAQARLSLEGFRQIGELLGRCDAGERRERATRSERAGVAASESACRGGGGAKPLGKA